MKWHYQFTPDDGHDWDSVQDMMLVDRVWRGEKRKLLMHADRNGHFYVLDRTNGKFLSGTPSSIRTGTRDSTRTDGRSRFRARTPWKRAACSCIRPSEAGRTSRRRPTAR
jgi:glucose dehydrogenase